MKQERFNSPGRFTESEIRSEIAASKRFWASPAGKAEKRRRDAADRNREYRGVKFPHLAAHSGTKPILTAESEVRDWAARFGK